MRRVFSFLFFSCFVISANAQEEDLDSLRWSYTNEKTDTGRSWLLSRLSYGYLNFNADTALLLAQEGLALAVSAQYTRGEAACLNAIANVFLGKGNYPKALELYLEALKKFESIGASDRVTAVLINIGFVYSSLGDYRKSLEYTFKGNALAKSRDDQSRLSSSYQNIADGYFRMGILDSAKYYANLANDLSRKINRISVIGLSLGTLGAVYFKRNELAIAMSYFRSASPYLEQIDLATGKCEVALGLARIFEKMGNTDSALYYAKQAWKTARTGGLTADQLDASTFLTDYYKKLSVVDSAYTYLAITIAIKDSMFSQEKSRQIQSLIFDENMRQQKMLLAQEKAKKERETNMQYAIMAIGLICFAVIFLLLSRSIIVNENWIRFLGVLGLLLVFEFINLFIHPYLGDLTHHSPVWMLLILVAIAALLIPLHHKLEHWVVHKMVARNKKIRLAAAKKTIAKLEGEMNAPQEQR